MEITGFILAFYIGTAVIMAPPADDRALPYRKVLTRSECEAQAEASKVYLRAADLPGRYVWPVCLPYRFERK